MATKILSIIIPTYNMEKYLRRCLDSLIVKEKFEMLEVWVVNDGSKDSSSAIAHEYADKYPTVFNVIDKPNGNYGSCINAALPRCTGKYVKVLDSDDYFNTSELELLIKRLKDADSDVILLDYTNISPEKRNKITFSYNDGEVINLQEQCPEYFGMHSIAYKTEMFKTFDYRQTEGVSYTDQEWIFYPMLHARTLKYFPLDIYQYVIGREGQTMDSDVFIRNIRTVMQLVSKMIVHLKQCKANETPAQTAYAENVLEHQIRLIYNVELVRLDKEDSHLGELKELDSLIASYDKRFYDRFNETSIRRMMPFVKNFRGGENPVKLETPHNEAISDSLPCNHSNKRIAAVVVTYNRKALLSKCLNAIKEQTLKPQTVYIIDNASTDGTPQAIENDGYLNTTVNDIQFKYIRLAANQGGAGGFYAGMKTAYEAEEQFDAVWVMDDDGQPDKACLCNLSKWLGEYHYISPLVLAVDDKRTLAFSYKDSYSVDFILENSENGLVKDFGCPMNGILFSRELIRKIGYPVPEMFIWGDEINYTLRAERAGFRVVTATSALHCHPKNRQGFEKTLFGQTVIYVKDFWRGYCFFRNQVYNDRLFGGKNKYLRMAGRYVKYMYYFAFVRRSLKWMLCFNDAFFSGFKKHPDRGYLKYMSQHKK